MSYIPVVNMSTLYTLSEGIKRKQFVGEFLNDEELHLTEEKIHYIAKYECGFKIPFHNEVIQDSDNTYQIQIWNEPMTLREPDRTIFVEVEHVLSFMNRHFKLGGEVEIQND